MTHRHAFRVGTLLLTLSTTGALANGFGTQTRWHDYFGRKQETVLTGDFNGDGFQDVVTLITNTASEPYQGDAWVAFSNGTTFGPSAQWSNNLAPSGGTPVVGDFDGDGRDDVAVLTQGVGTDPTRADVLVYRSTGSSFLSPGTWSFSFCSRGGLPLAGDFNGDGRDDLACVYRDTLGTGPGRGDVHVALSRGTSFAPAALWHDWFGIGNEWPVAGDFNGDGKHDLAVLVRPTLTGAGGGNVWVTLSTGASFGPSSVWHNAFGKNDELPRVGDFNGDGKDDVAVFTRDQDLDTTGRGDVFVALSGGGSFGPSQVWHDWLAIGQEIPEIGDFNRDGKDDVAVFIRDTQTGDGLGDVWVALAGAPSEPARNVSPASFGHGSMRVNGKQALGNRPLLVLMLEFGDVRFTPDVTPSALQQRFFTSPTSVAGLFGEMSGGRFHWVPAGSGVFGPVALTDLSSTYGNDSLLECAIHTNRSNPACGTLAYGEYDFLSLAIQRAYQTGFRFAPYDTNRDGRVTDDELSLFVFDARTGGSGMNRRPGACVAADVQVCMEHVASANAGTNLSTLAHELAHSLGTLDVYGTAGHNTPVSLMGGTWSPDLLHLDPWHKLVLGWVEPRIYSLKDSGSCQWLDAAALGGEGPGNWRKPILLFHPGWGTREFFLLEYRTSQGLEPFPYEAAAAGPGLAAWQVKTTAANLLDVVPGYTIHPGANGLLETALHPNDVLGWLYGARTIEAGADFVLNSTPAGDDVIMKDPALFTVGAPNGMRGRSTLWTSAEPAFSLQRIDGSDTSLFFEVGLPGVYGNTLPVRWSPYGFNGQLSPSLQTDDALRSCYQAIP